MRAETSGVRLSILGVAVLALFGALFARLWFLQVASSPTLEAKVAQGNVRTVTLLPSRGRILDARGRVLAENKAGLSVTIDRNGIRSRKNRTHMFELLSGPLGKSVDELEARYTDVQYEPLLPLPLAEDIPESMALWLRERIVDYPGLDIAESSERSYRYSPVGSNIVGYMGKIQKETLKKYKEKGYTLNEIVGIYGVEASFQDQLRGTPGYKKVIVDSNNRVLDVIEKVDPEPGKDVRLTVDIQMQQYAELILNAEMLKRRQEHAPRSRGVDNELFGPEKANFTAPEGALVVENATNGEVVAMASNPSFDNRWYDGHTSGDVLNQLFGSTSFVDNDGVPSSLPNNNAPLVDRSISTQYNIGSTMKLFTSVAGLREGLITGSTHFLDKGTWSLPESQCKKGEPVECSKTNADRAVYGDLTLPGALTVSSDAFFYDLGARLWYDTPKGSDLLQKELHSFGFGSRLGIQLPSENAGLVPDAKVKKQLALNGVIDKFAGSDFFTGDNVNLAIGQGFIGITPLQLANGYASFANGGTVWKPRIAKMLYEPGTADLAFHLADVAHAQVSTTYLPEKFGDVDLPADMVDPIKRGLRGVVSLDKVNGFSSTAGAAFAGWDFEEFPIWGKTGTAQAGDQDSEKDTSLFASFGGPKDEPPKYAVASVIKYAGFGGQASAPVVKCIYTVLKDPSLLPALLYYAPLDKTVVVPRQWPEHKDFDASCLNIATAGTVLRER